jgi:hypothetical protein
MSSAPALNALLTVDPELRRSRFAWLRDYSESPAPSNILELLSRLEYARALKIDPERAGRIHAARLGRLVDEGTIMTVQHIVDLEPARRTAILVAQVADVEARLADATLAMFEKYMGSLFTKARNRDEQRFQATKRDVAKALLLFRRTIAALKQARQTGEDGVAVVDREVGMRQLDECIDRNRSGRAVLEGICVVVGHLSARGPWGEFQVPPPRQTTCSLGYPNEASDETREYVSFGLIVVM